MAGRPPDDLSAAFDVIDGNLSPATGVGGVVAVIAHAEDVTGSHGDGAKLAGGQFVGDGCVPGFANPFGVPELTAFIGQIHVVVDGTFIEGLLWDGLIVDVNDLFADFDFVAFDTDNAFDVVLFIGEGFGLETTGIGTGKVGGGFFSGKGEDDDVAALRGGKPDDVFVDKGQAKAVAEFGDKELIAFHQGGDHGTRGNFEGFDEEGAQNERKSQGEKQAFDDFLKTRFAGEHQAFLSDRPHLLEGGVAGMGCVLQGKGECMDGLFNLVALVIIEMFFGSFVEFSGFGE